MIPLQTIAFIDSQPAVFAKQICRFTAFSSKELIQHRKLFTCEGNNIIFIILNTFLWHLNSRVLIDTKFVV